MARACSPSRQASVTACPRSPSRRANTVPHDPPPTTTAFMILGRRSFALDEVDRHGDTFEVEALAQLVLDPVPVVARDEAGVVDEDAKPRRPRRHLRAVEQPQAAAALRRARPRLAQLAERP